MATRWRRRHHCMVVHAYYPLAETRVQRQAEALLEAGYTVDVVCLRARNDAAEEVVDGVEVHRLPVRRNREESGFARQLIEYANFAIRATVMVLRLHLRRRYGVIQVHNPPDFLIVAGLVPRILGARVILDLHDLMPEFLASKISADLDHPAVRLVRLQERLACRLADHVVTVTGPWRETLIRRGVKRARSSVVMNVADVRYFGPAAGGRGSPSDGDFRLIYHGTLAYRYGVDLLVCAVARLRPEIPALRATIHGEGEMRQRLSDLVAELGVGDIVRLSFDNLPVNELPELIRSADVGVVPYRRDVFTEGILPTKLMEYAALGMPAIAVPTEAIRAYFDGSMVEFVEPGDLDDLVRAIAALHRDTTRRAELARNTERFNERHNWPAEAAAYVKLVGRLSGEATDRDRAVL